MNIERSNDIWNVGGKAYYLLRLQEVTFNVPSFFVLRINDEMELDSPTNRKLIINECDKLGCSFFSVRSSATCEDGINDSFSGLFDSCICVGISNIFDAIRVVLQSARSERVKEYCKIKHGDINYNFEMRVIIQKQLDSRLSGICFTRHPLQKENVLLESCYGQGEILASGIITPETYIVSRNVEHLSISSYFPGYQNYAIYLGRNEECSINSYSHIRRVHISRDSNEKMLKNNEIKKIVQQSLLAEKCLEMNAADVEWVFQNEELFFVQIRPLINEE